MGKKQKARKPEATVWDLAYVTSYAASGKTMADVAASLLSKATARPDASILRLCVQFTNEDNVPQYVGEVFFE